MEVFRRRRILPEILRSGKYRPQYRVFSPVFHRHTLRETNRIRPTRESEDSRDCPHSKYRSANGLRQTNRHSNQTRTGEKHRDRVCGHFVSNMQFVFGGPIRASFIAFYFGGDDYLPIIHYFARRERIDVYFPSG